MSYQQSRAILREFTGSRPIAYYPGLAKKVGGAKAAIMLSQLLYWSENRVVKERDGWLYKSVEEFEEETGLTKREQQTARNKLSSIGVIDIELKGIPRTWYYRVNFNELIEYLTASHWEQNRPNVGTESVSMLETKAPQLNNESENTTENTHAEQEKKSSEDDFSDWFENRPAPKIRKLRSKEDIRAGVMRAIGKFEDKYKDGELPLADYPEVVRPALRQICLLWGLRPASGKSKGMWIDSTMEIIDTCEGLDVTEVIARVQKDCERREREGGNPLTISGPQSLVNMCRAKAGEMRIKRDEPVQTSEDGSIYV